MRVGSVVDGKYEILKMIGQGGMSTIYLAMDMHLNKQWAIKAIKRKVNRNYNEINMHSLLAEANLMKRLDHPSLPRIVDIINDGETIYIVMDYIEGEPLDKVLLRYGAQPQEIVIEWALQLCDILQYLHFQTPPIVYRDMKPSNIMLKPEGNLKVIDFGIAREYKEQNLEDTISLGTKGYAAPEQFGGKGQTDGRTDIYGLGVTLYHLVTGQNPCEPPYELCPIRQTNPALSGGLERIIKKCTQPNPEDRYQNCAELIYALEHYEEEDDVYIKKLKRKGILFIVTSSLCLILAIIGIAGNLLVTHENNKDYEQKIGISTATDYQTKVSTYMEAINIIGDDRRAYLKLLDAYKENNLFSDTQSSQFSALYNTNKDKFQETDEDYLHLNYESGITYFNLYSGGDNSFRTRVLKAHPYFTTIYESGVTNFKYYNLAESYYIVGNFYKQYVVNATSVKEPTKEAYETLLGSLETCMDNVEQYYYDDSAYIKLTLYQEISNLLNDHRKGFATTGVSQESVLDLLDHTYEKVNAISVTQSTSVSIQESIISNYEGYVDSIKRAYINVGERS